MTRRRRVPGGNGNLTTRSSDDWTLDRDDRRRVVMNWCGISSGEPNGRPFLASQIRSSFELRDRSIGCGRWALFIAITWTSFRCLWVGGDGGQTRSADSSTLSVVVVVVVRLALTAT